MKNILLIGAGLSSSSLIKYLLDHSEQYDWKLRIGDVSKETADNKINGHKNGSAFIFDINNESQREEEVKKADIVISMLPAKMHPLVIKCCIKNKKNMVTASYVSDEMKSLEDEINKSGILILNEVGLDPGIDHMSAMQVIDRLKEQGAKITAFRSYTGGLVAPQSDNNPWNYKFTWNPRNVVVAGQGAAAQYILNGEYKYIPYHRLFTETTQTEILNYGKFEGYPNRDSLKYRSIYQLENIQTMIRGTFRRSGYCEAWNLFVQLGLTEDAYHIENSENMTYREFINAFLPYDAKLSVEEKFMKMFNLKEDSQFFKKFKWLGIFENTKISLKNATPAQALQKILEEKWKLDPQDIDMIVMQHLFEFELNGKKKEIASSLVVEGIDNIHTAMAITVGVPAAIAVKMILTGQIKDKGIQVPVKKTIYEPILQELKNYKVKFIESERDLN
jgi:saccharopine dehydrogenase-like NADP-dependent oxidoreductase